MPLRRAHRIREREWRAWIDNSLMRQSTKMLVPLSRTRLCVFLSSVHLLSAHLFDPKLHDW
jgi:hypothetical protein